MRLKAQEHRLLKTNLVIHNTYIYVYIYYIKCIYINEDPLKTPPSSKKARVESLHSSSPFDPYRTPPSSTSRVVVCLSTGSPIRPKTAPKPLLKPTDKRSSATDFTPAFQVSLRFRRLLEVIILTHNIFRLHLIRYIKYFRKKCLK